MLKPTCGLSSWGCGRVVLVDDVAGRQLQLALARALLRDDDHVARPGLLYMAALVEGQRTALQLLQEDLDQTPRAVARPRVVLT